MGLGLLARSVRYGLDFPLWGDEAFVAVDFLFRDYAGFLNPLTYGQIVPLLYTWGTLAFSQVLGTSEAALRLLPLLASIVSLPLFYRFASKHASRWATALALGFLGSAYYPIRHAVEVKPYATDLLISLILSMLAWRVYENPRRLGRWGLLIALGAIAPWCSYPAVFVCGAVAMLLAYQWWVWRRRFEATATLAGGTAFVALFLGSALSMYAVYAKPQLEYGARLQEIRMWTETFPPVSNPPKLLLWLVTTHSGTMLAYPNGGKNGGSTLTLICVIAGSVALWQRNRALLLLLLGPLPLNFVVAAFQRYPYGGTVRISMFLAPMICLLAGIGLAELLRMLVRPERVRLAFQIAACVLAAFAVGSVVADLVQPFKKEANQLARQTVRDYAAAAWPGDRWIAFNAIEQVAHAPYIRSWKGDGAQFIYYMTRLAPGAVNWAPAAETVGPHRDGRTLLWAYHGANFPAFQRPQFEAYVSRLSALLGEPTYESIVLQTRRDAVWQALDVYVWQPSP